MDRVTTRDINGSAIFLHDKWYAELLERLAAYEDTGLEPEEIWRYQKAETGRAAAGAFPEAQLQRLCFPGGPLLPPQRGRHLFRRLF